MADQAGSAPVEGEIQTVYRQRFTVEFGYDVHFTENALDPANPVLLNAVRRLEPDARHRIAAFVDSGVAEAMPDLPRLLQDYCNTHGKHLDLVAPAETVPGGEPAKNDPAVAERVLGRLKDLGIDRHAFVLAIGGGAMLDAVGYAAATAHRGVRLLRMPTTVLAQNDSGIGVKTGINAFGVKNMVGVFAPPFAVINDARFLDSLEPRDRVSGMAEAVKVALIRDAGFFVWLERHAEDLAAFRRPAVAEMIRRCAELHMRQIAQGGDPFETGSARPLDYGHWSAHKLEGLSGYALRHGEAVAIGIALDTRYSVLAGMLAEGEDERVCRVLERLGFKLWDDTLTARAADGEPAVLRGLQEFREHLGGELTVTLLAGIGRGQEVHTMDAQRVRAAIDWLAQRNRRQCS
ncbi:3-dehydroquinate synthase [Ferruginivarius sediminum]|uniref:3-dehydroquinate synthase n=1 Tax=Ferruginivarius sediminum TaxID=2661937 RepID=A0A369TBM4_9PROT|nr:3-dehydroquinate synthase [Ferruginivarius sediminum]RDD62670.1 3-dehydroquinate synthase [Ferruginivarius sediminum]